MKLDFRLYLGPLDLDDADQARHWRNDYQVWAWTRQSDFISDVEQRAWFRRQSEDPTIKMYAIRVQAGAHETLVGVCGLTSLDWLHRRAEFSLFIAPEHQRRGYGREALKLLLAHGFTNLGLHQIWAETFASNPAINIFAALGMKLDGTRRQFYYKDGRFTDAYLVSILREEWEHVASGKPATDPDHADPPPRGDPAAEPAPAGAERAQEAPAQDPPPLRKPRRIRASEAAASGN